MNEQAIKEEIGRDLVEMLDECPKCSLAEKVQDYAASLGRQPFKAGDWVYFPSLGGAYIAAEDGYVGDHVRAVCYASEGRPDKTPQQYRVSHLASKRAVKKELVRYQNREHVQAMIEKISKDFINDNK